MRCQLRCEFRMFLDWRKPSRVHAPQSIVRGGNGAVLLSTKFALMIAAYQTTIAVYGINDHEYVLLKIICRSGGGIYFDVHR